MGCGASGSRHNINYVEEVTPGVTPATPVFKEFRNTDWNVDLKKTEIVSAEKRSDRNIANVRHGNKETGGDIPVAFAADAFDDALEAVLCGTWTANVLKNGTEYRTFTFENNFTDITQYVRDLNQVFNTFTLTVEPDAEVTGSFGFVGGERAMDQAPIAGATYTGVTTTVPFDSFSATITEGGVLSGVVTSLTVNVDNGAATVPVVGTDLPACISKAECKVTGTISAQFVDEVFMEKFINETESSLVFTLTDGAKTQTHTLGKIKYSGASAPKSGSSDIFINMPFTAYLDPIDSSTYKIERS